MRTPKQSAACSAPGIEATLDHFDPESEVVFRPQVTEPGPFHGHAELRAWLEGFRTAWGSSHVELIEIVARGGAR